MPSKSDIIDAGVVRQGGRVGGTSGAPIRLCNVAGGVRVC